MVLSAANPPVTSFGRAWFNSRVHTYVAYLARLPFEEQLYWLSFNEWPKGNISRRAYQNDILGEFSTEDDPLADLHERLPDHSSWTRIRQRWGEKRFRKIFQRTVTACLDGNIATAEVVHINASLIRANVSWESLVERHAGDVMAANPDDREMEAGGKRRRVHGNSRKVSLTDADTSMATSAENRRLEPCYKQHTAVDDRRGVVLDVAVTTGAASERATIESQVDEVRAIADREIETVTRPMPVMPLPGFTAGLNAAASIR